MNYLAHLLLSPRDTEVLVGNFLGDFVKGNAESLRGRFPDRVLWGIEMHRAVDGFTDRHWSFQEARSLLSDERRRFGGIVVDVFYDYFLCERWEDFSEEKLDDFIEWCYEALEGERRFMDDEAWRVFQMMRDNDWLSRYGTWEGLAVTFSEVSRRRDFLAPVKGSMVDFKENEETLRESFAVLFPELVGFLEGWKRTGS